MANENAVQKKVTVATLAHNEQFNKRIEETLGRRTPQFMTSVTSLVNSNKAFENCNPYDIFNACLVAASMNLPVNKDLGQAWVIPYGNTPQLQIGWKGYVQLAQRSGLFKTINTTDVREGEIVSRDLMTGEFEFKWIQDDAERNKKPVVGYLAYFKLLNGFEKNLYMTVEELQAHGAKYSKTYKSSSSVWKTDFAAMASKTVLKLLLNRYAPLEIDSDLARAIQADQADSDGDYIDNPRNIEIVDAMMGSSEEQDNAAEAEVIEEK